MWIVAGSGRFILFRVSGTVTLSPADEGHRTAALHDAAEVAALQIPVSPPEAWVVQILPGSGPPRFAIVEELQFSNGKGGDHEQPD